MRLEKAGNWHQSFYLTPMVGMKLAIELFDSGNKSLMIYGINERNLFIQTMARLIV